MSRFLSSRLKGLEPYVPGEQPKIDNLIKLNTNESPFPPSENAIRMSAEAAKNLQLYPDPECSRLTETLAQKLGVAKDEILLTNGSDEILNFAFMAFCDSERGAVFADITYGFYKVFAQLNGVPYREIALDENLKINLDDYKGTDETIFIANPNAPTGLYYEPEEIEKVIASNPDRVVVVDEAYIDFGGRSCVPLIKKYDNLLVTQTFSKSRSMAGARLGFGVGCKGLIADLNTIKYSTNPYNINSATMAAGIGSLTDEEYTVRNCNIICQNREYTTQQLIRMGFDTTDSKTNFIFAKHKTIDGGTIYRKLRERGIVVRHFLKDRISDYNRITVGTKEQMDSLLCALEDIIKEETL
ncbi:MAG: histidinol-phosphate transaminase [Ruminococcaceae bacterium]|nr:histidinol-phosphate transaminase [Oscillospiraceae bacterium]